MTRKGKHDPRPGLADSTVHSARLLLIRSRPWSITGTTPNGGSMRDSPKSPRRMLVDDVLGVARCVGPSPRRC